MKNIYVGCTFFISGIILYSLRLVAGVIYDAARMRPISGGGSYVIENISPIFLIGSIVLIILGLLLIIRGYFKD
ncbi:hypothetical protein OMP38_16415 [Cohnella ginsengisoli]|uniref:Uncharacterized protein n=1 Tax=Cohnella ginsengisoli TaxID=425004 RepID=A0A9X4QP37_9BACL|nr:hypothetical protein [Cohnella ginsengisoli]MDG0792275.1 hypothetical protein [Cohnella ginsengisoli]